METTVPISLTLNGVAAADRAKLVALAIEAVSRP